MSDAMTQIISLIHTRAASYDAMAADEWEHAAACATALRSVADDLRPLLADLIAAKDAEIARLQEAMTCGLYFANGEANRSQFETLARAARKGDTHE